MPLAGTAVSSSSWRPCSFPDHAAERGRGAKPTRSSVPSLTGFIILFLGGFAVADGAASTSWTAPCRPSSSSTHGQAAFDRHGRHADHRDHGMFMSNTATTATMFAVMMPVVWPCPRQRRARASPCRSPRTSAAWAPVGTPRTPIALGAGMWVKTMFAPAGCCCYYRAHQPLSW